MDLRIKLSFASLYENDFSFFPSGNEHFVETKDFEEVSYLLHIKYIDTNAEEFENRLATLKKSKEISVFTQPLTISVEKQCRPSTEIV